MRTECSECGATYSAASECRICAQPLTAASALLSPNEAEQLRTAHESRARPSSDPSGLIDIRQISEKLRAEARGVPRSAAPLAAAAVGGLALPSFAGDGLDGLSVSPLLPTAPAPSTAAPATPSRGPVYALLSVLTLGVLGLGAIVVKDQLAPPPSPAPVVAAAPVLEQPEADEPDEPETPETPAEPEADPEAEANPADDPSDKPSERRRPRPQSTNKPSPTPKPSPSPKPTPKLDDDALVDCLLGSDDPKCKTKPGPSSTPKPKPKPTPSSEELPSKLGSSEISSAIKPIKAAAKSCGSGTTVAVKFSVEGASGKVSSATPLDEHANSTVGACVAKAARGAEFPRFGSARQGFTFKFRL